MSPVFVFPMGNTGSTIGQVTEDRHTSHEAGLYPERPECQPVAS
ncbi:hypothetical protein MiSe_38130 [Microseira wollei NIES-4236]|uniref:Uncharacterized protein n=1 Tax=Microseira wollei NIES-4236 TaxID=2530354 RepID=A0AAV3XFA0_9CYAN|nr:hypothetical protein MiSe_38130 [Microseira wollei NIES-4236]